MIIRGWLPLVLTFLATGGMFHISSQSATNEDVTAFVWGYKRQPPEHELRDAAAITACRSCTCAPGEQTCSQKSASVMYQTSAAAISTENLGASG
jgi:hypothetical protein